MAELSSRERMLRALNCQTPDYTPCSFMLYKALQLESKDYLEFIERQIAMGLDTYVMIPPRDPKVMTDTYNLHGMPVRFHPEVKIKEWKEKREGYSVPVLVKEYHTPAGTLRAEARQTDDWLWGDHIPFLDDYLTSRSVKFLVTEMKDLDSLRYLLVPPTAEEIEETRCQSEPVLAFAKEKELLVTGGWGVGADLLGWIYGLEKMIYTVYDAPDFLQAMLEIIAEWNQARMKVLLDLGIDLYIKRAWYEMSHFWTPTSFKKFLLPILKADVEMAHEAGAKFGYIVTAGAMPLLDLYLEAGVDVLIGVDPHEWDMALTKEKVGKRICLWGGVNGHLTVETGGEEDVRAEVQAAMKVLAPGGGFILSPVDNVREHTLVMKRNVAALIEAWQELR